MSVCLSIYLSIYLSLSLYVSIDLSIYRSIYLHRQAGKTFGACGRRQPCRHPHRNSIQIHGLELMSLSVLYGLRDGLSWELVSCGLLCTWARLSPLDCSMPIVQIASKALHDANDALLGVHCITRITRPNLHCFSDPRFGALSLSKGPSQRRYTAHFGT